MPLITLDEAAARIGVTRETFDQWLQQGILPIYQRSVPAQSPTGDARPPRLEQCVDEDEVVEIADSIGWFMLSAENWDGAEAE